MHESDSRPQALALSAILLLTALAVLALAGTGSASSAACSFCGKNLILNPGAEGGRG